MEDNRNQLYAGIIWIISAVALGIYGVLLFLNSTITGIKELVHFLSNINDGYIYLAAFISVLVEGLYFVGSFFPGASLIMILAIISGTNGYIVFCTTLLLIFIGWNIAGIVNIYLAKIYREKIVRLQYSKEYLIKDRIWATWFPAFRSSYEVAQVMEGGSPMGVFLSSLRVKFWSTLFVGGLALSIPFVLDIDNLSSRENFFTIFIVFSISLIVGIRKIRNYLLSN